MSLLGPIQFTICMTPVADILKEPRIGFHVYADDHQSHLAFLPIDQDSADLAVNKITRCIVEIKQWMVKNMLKLNDDKTEFIVIGTRQQRSNIAPISTVRNLGVMFDSEMSMKAHVSSINWSAYPQLKNVRAIKPFLDTETANTAAQVFVNSHLEAGNSILYGIAQCHLQCIQRTQNIVARIVHVTDTCRYEHIIPFLHQLH